MKDKTITYSISQGMYVLTTNGGGCMVDAVSQISGGDNPLISVSVMKNNYTNELMKKNDKFALSIISMNSNPDIIETFGMHSCRDYDKFSKVELEQIDGLNIIKDSIGYMMMEVVDTIDADTHTLFIGRMIKCDRFNKNEPMTYGYYQKHKDELIKKISTEGKTAWVCPICGYVYYGEELPADFKCPLCGVSKDLFKKVIK